MVVWFIMNPHMADNPVDEKGGNGLVMTVDDHLAVTQDLIADEPKLLIIELGDLLCLFFSNVTVH